ncbi:MAG TPA: HEAT repeat domain-containing protein [Verrucomicrobiae bacterium]
MKLFCQVLAVGALVWAGPRACAAEEAQVAGDLDQAVASAAAYESGQSLEPFRRLEEAVRDSGSNPAARRELEAALIKLLGTGSSFEARRFACKQLGIIGSPAALPALARLLTDSETAGIACLALTTYPPGKADEVLRAGLSSATGTARIQIINTLGDRRDAKSIALLARLAAASDQPPAEAATASLGKIGTPGAWQAIRSLRAGTGGELAGTLADAMLRCAANLNLTGHSKTAFEIYEDLLANGANIAVRRSALSALLTLDEDQGQKRILEVLSGKDDALKPVAIARVASVDSPGASEEFATQMHHLKPEHQVLLVERLAARDDESARLELAKSLTSTEPMVRRAAVVALGRLGDPYYVGMLAQAAGAATDPDESRAVEAALVGMKGGAETDRMLVAHLRLASPKARVPLIAAVTRRQGAAASPVLLEETANSDPAVARAAFRALAKVGTGKEAAPVLAKLVALVDAGVRADAESTAAQLLAKLPDAAQRSAAVREALARAPTVETRSACLALLPVCGDPTALEDLQRALNDSEPEVREAAVRALADWPNDSAWGDLMAVYRQQGQDKLHGVALRGFTRLLGEQNAHPDAALMGRYKLVLQGARSDTDYRLILGVLAGVAHPDALPLVLPLLSNPSIRAEVVLAAKQIIEAIKAEHPQVAEEALKKLTGPPQP